MYPIPPVVFSLHHLNARKYNFKLHGSYTKKTGLLFAKTAHYLKQNPYAKLVRLPWIIKLMSNHDHSITNQFDRVLSSSFICRITIGTALAVFGINKNSTFIGWHNHLGPRSSAAQQLNTRLVAKLGLHCWNHCAVQCLLSMPCFSFTIYNDSKHEVFFHIILYSACYALLSMHI